jgi:hypothetical protein
MNGDTVISRSQWLLSVRRRSATARLLVLRVRILPGRGYLSLVNVVCCQVEVFTTDRSLVQRSPAKYVCVIECDQVQQLPSTPKMSR